MKKANKVPAIEIKKMGGIKCDNPDCGWEDMNIKVDQYKDYINAKCPCCGEIIMTEKDYKSFKFILRIIKIINFILPKRVPDKEKDAVMTCEFDGSGKVNSSIRRVNCDDKNK